MTSAPLPELGRRSRLETEIAARVAGIFERHGRMVYGVCRTMLRDAHEAEDATQQVFLSAHRALLGGAHVRDSGAWLATIARNECRGRITTGMRSPLPLADEDLEAIASPVDVVERSQQVQELRRALAELSERQREAVVLRYFYGLRYGEVATALGLSRAATEALLFRARRAMRIRLRPVVGAVLVVPLAVREELALAIPGFATTAGTSAVAAGAAGGVLAKLTAGSVGVKVATAAVAVSTVGAAGAVERRPARDVSDRAQITAVADAQPSGEDGGHEGRGPGAHSGDEQVNRGPGGGGDEGEGEGEGEGGKSGPGGGSDARTDASGESSGPGSGRVDDESERSDSSGSGSGSIGSPASSGPSSPEQVPDDSSGPGSGDGGEDSSSSGPGSGSRGDGSGSSGSGSGGDGGHD